MHGLSSVTWSAALCTNDTSRQCDFTQRLGLETDDYLLVTCVHQVGERLERVGS